MDFTLKYKFLQFPHSYVCSLREDIQLNKNHFKHIAILYTSIHACLYTITYVRTSDINLPNIIMVSDVG